MGRVTIFAVFRELGNDFVDMYVYGNYFALIGYVYVLIILSGSCRLRFFEHSLVGSG